MLYVSLHYRSINDSVTSSEIRDEADLLLRGDLDPSDSMCAFLDGEIPKQELVTFHFKLHFCSDYFVPPPPPPPTHTH